MTLTRRHPKLTDEIFEQLNTEYLAAFESGRLLANKTTQQTSHCQLGGRSYFIKRYQSSSPLATARLLCKQSRADRSFDYALELTRQGITTPRHLLVIKQLCLTKAYTFLVMEQSPGQSLYHFLNEEGDFDPLPPNTLANIASLITKLQSLGLYHGDLHARNLIISPEGNIEMIDLDNIRYSSKRTHKDVTRLLRSLSNRKHAHAHAAMLEALATTP